MKISKLIVCKVDLCLVCLKHLHKQQMLVSKIKPLEQPMYQVASKWAKLMNQQRIPFTTCEDMGFIMVYPIGLRFIQQAERQASKLGIGFGW